ncbi:hypothetical protein [Hydrogenoanaerobacterium sp.]|uniref:hypothetical protein n=1 Tax=Hydrogenoanaerobacterium sp. TaxID=2953763 RepID=UPI00289B2174|nr:hypothetical protein [Hydrogenoanaerobacterium sp.]
MSNDMVERYVYAVTKNLPAKMRGDIRDELNGLIVDMLEERCGEVTPTERDIRVVLAELGTPAELAEKYNPDGDKCLIGAPYYSKYKMVLKIVLASVVFGMALSGFITVILDPEAVWYFAIWQWLGMIFMGLVYAFAFVTVIFAVFQRKGINIDTAEDQISNLPPVPKKREIISKWECIVDIAFSVLFAVVFLFAPQIICGVFDQNLIIPVFDSEKIRNIWYVIVAFAALGIIKDSVKLYEGRYTKRLATVTLVVNILMVPLTFMFLLDNQIMNPVFTQRITDMFGKDGAFIATAFANFNLFFLAIVSFALILDTTTTIIRAMESPK